VEAPVSDRRALVATPAARDRAIERLQEHLAKNHIELDRFEELVELAERATTDAQLVALFDALPSLEAVEKPGQVTSTVKAMFATVSRRGRFAAPSRVEVSALFGAVELDLTEVELSRDETIIDVNAWFGSISITLPEGLAVTCEGGALFGSFDHVSLQPASRRDPRRVRIVGNARFGSVEIIVKKRVGALQRIGDGIRALLGGEQR
jgi:hypothetical protein